MSSKHEGDSKIHKNRISVTMQPLMLIFIFLLTRGLAEDTGERLHCSQMTKIHIASPSERDEMTREDGLFTEGDSDRRGKRLSYLTCLLIDYTSSLRRRVCRSLAIHSCSIRSSKDDISCSHHSCLTVRPDIGTHNFRT